MSDLVGNTEDHFSQIAAMNENCTAIANLINMDFFWIYKITKNFKI